MKVIYKDKKHERIHEDYEAGMALIRPCDEITTMSDKGFWVRIDEIEEYHEFKDPNPYGHNLDHLPKKPFIFFPKNDFEKHIGKLCDELKETLIKKNRDYGDSFSTIHKKYGDVSTSIRLFDKLNRFDNLLENGNLVKDESKEDTIKDIAGYSVLHLAIKRMG